MAKTYFVTGTDTGVGKTFVTCTMLEAANRLGLRTLALKPVAAGAERYPDGMKNEDAVALQKHASLSVSYAQVNPVLLHAPIAPHIAANQEGRKVTVARLAGLCRGALMTPHDLSFIEGAGGWLVPLNSREVLADLALALNTPVILVIGLRLGCLNHALLTAGAIRQRGAVLAGWVANQCGQDPMPVQQENLLSLNAALGAPWLGTIPYAESPECKQAMQAIDVDALL
jgi:dethiobiotin synthetase